MRDGRRGLQWARKLALRPNSIEDLEPFATRKRLTRADSRLYPPTALKMSKTLKEIHVLVTWRNGTEDPASAVQKTYVGLIAQL
jgi:hypothetical protein